MKELLLMDLLQDREDTFLIMVAFMKVVLRKMMRLGLEHIVIPFKDIIMRESGLEMFLLVKVNKNSQTDHIMKDSFHKEQKTDMEGMFPIQEFMKVSLKREIFMEKELFHTLIIVCLQETG